MRWIGVMMALACGAWALGQTPPAGNAHPATELVPEVSGALPAPFGPVDWRARVQPVEKWAFSRSVDLSPLRDVVVFHNGREKIVDTLARETVRTVTGRSRYVEVERTEGGQSRTLSYDPLFTWLDMMIEPGSYAARPLVAVEYLPLRDALLELAIEDDRERERYRRLGRLPPALVEAVADAALERHGTEAAFVRAMDRVDSAMRLYLLGAATLLVVPPESPDRPYAHLVTLPEGDAARTAAMALGTAWRERDPSAASAAARALADALNERSASTHSGTRRAIELAYNKWKPFELGFWAYLVALVTLVLAFGTGRGWLAITGGSVLALALVLHAAGFVARCVLAERFAIQNQFESMTGLSLFGAVLGAAMMVRRRDWLFGAASAGLGFLVLVTATQTAIPGQSIEREAAILNTSVLLKYHVTTVLASYGLITLGFLVSLMYLGTYVAARVRGRLAEAPRFVAGALGGEGEPRGIERTLHDLDRAQMAVLQMAFWALAVGIMLGAWWADHSWGRFWAWDPKETWALVTWIIYLVVIHVRLVVRRRGLVTAWLSVVGFGMMAWTYFGVNLLLPGLHAYA